jgi:3',5'-nucleoside bisphosphate phosphatase
MAPAEVLHAMRSHSVDYFSLTDHDTTAGCHKLGVTAGLIPGVEITAGFSGREIHIVGLGIDLSNAPLQEFLSSIRALRLRRLTVLINRLPDDVRRGLTLAELHNDPAARYSETLGRLHVAKALVRRGGVPTINDVFTLYLGDEHTCDPELEAFPAIDAVVSAIRNANGIAILAHPGVYKELSYIETLLHHDLDGVEINHPNLDPSLHANLIRIANEKKLFMSSGSDMHFLGKRIPGNWSMGEMHQRLLERLVA